MVVVALSGVTPLLVVVLVGLARVAGEATVVVAAGTTVATLTLAVAAERSGVCTARPGADTRCGWRAKSRSGSSAARVTSLPFDRPESILDERETRRIADATKVNGSSEKV